MTINPAQAYTAVVKTDVGTFDIALNAKAAPVTVNSFIFLARHNYFNCQSFMRVIPGFMEQTGSPNQTNSGPGSGPGYEFKNENSSPPGGYVAGDVAMANSGANTNGSQFFIVAAPWNSSGYSLFGKVTSGMSVIKLINSQGNPSQSANGMPPLVIHRMLSVTITP
ncbi:MAG: peptidylprolyl isomerase [Actinobacteria bacterium]|nr:peptidylprolyl isomerase [Actinomycetota bacterium]